MLPADLVEILACPRSKQPLIYFPRGETNTADDEAFLVCPASRLRYRIEEGVPVLLAEEASELSDTRLHELISRAHQLGLPVPA